MQAQSSAFEIAGGNHKVVIELLRRDYPDANDYWDGNWVTWRFTLAIPRSANCLPMTILVTDSLHLGDLEMFRKSLSDVSSAGHGDAHLAMMEQYLRIVASLDTAIVRWKGRIRQRNCQLLDRPDDSPHRVLRNFTFDTEPSSFPNVLDQLNRVLTEFPIRSQRKHREKVDDRSVAAVTEYLVKGGNPNRMLSAKQSLLSSVCRIGHLDAVRILLDAGADINRRDPDGNTPLWNAYLMDRREILRLLLDRGANVNIPLDDGEYMLTRAIDFDKEEVAQLLIDHGADPNRADDLGKTPLICAAMMGHLNVARALREAGADPWLRDNKGKTAHDWAVESGWTDPEVADVLL